MSILDVARATPDKKTAVLLGAVESGVETKVDGIEFHGIAEMEFIEVVELIRKNEIDLPVFVGISIHELDVYQDMLEDEGIIPTISPG